MSFDKNKYYCIIDQIFHNFSMAARIRRGVKNSFSKQRYIIHKFGKLLAGQSAALKNKRKGPSNRPVPGSSDTSVCLDGVLRAFVRCQASCWGTYSTTDLAIVSCIWCIFRVVLRPLTSWWKMSEGFCSAEVANRCTLRRRTSRFPASLISLMVQLYIFKTLFPFDLCHTCPPSVHHSGMILDCSV